ncbi:MAG: class I SAM-dependent methyltransferase [Chlamydiia bacterium]|nr:class I SAM-dependent methyltransferase [Chlamydiia bacterium]
MTLKVISSQERSKPLKAETSSRIQAKAKYERLWLQRSKRLAKELLQEEKLIDLLQPIRGKKALDLGCGAGEVAKFLAKNGMQVDAVDVATGPLKELQGVGNLHTIEGFVPYAPLEEGVYDLVVAANLIAEVPKELRRLAMSQIAGLVKTEGIVVISTPLDVNSEDVLELFLGLVMTELEIESVVVSHFWLNQKVPFLKTHRGFQTWLEKVSEFLSPEDGVTDVIVKGTLRNCL